MDCSPPGSSIHGIFQARTLEWVAISFSRASSWPRDQTQVFCVASRSFTNWAKMEAWWWRAERLIRDRVGLVHRRQGPFSSFHPFSGACSFPSSCRPAHHGQLGLTPTKSAVRSRHIEGDWMENHGHISRHVTRTFPNPQSLTDLSHECMLSPFSLTLCDPMDCSPPGSSVHGILQIRVLEWVATPSSGGSSQSREPTWISLLLHWQAGSLPLVPSGKPNLSHRCA